MNQKKNGQDVFIWCVNENYDLINSINKIVSHSLDNEAYKFFVFSLRDTYARIEEVGFEGFPKDFPEAEFFNKMLALSKDLSYSANRVALQEKDPKYLDEKMDNYISYGIEWVNKYSIYLKK